MNETQFRALPLAQRKAIQQRLKDQGLYAGGIDGKFGAGTAAALQEAERRRQQDAARAETNRLESQRLQIEAERARAETAQSGARTEALQAATHAAQIRRQQAESTSGLIAQGVANLGAPIAGYAIGRGIGGGINALSDISQRRKNETLAAAAEDRLRGLTTREGARTGTNIAGALPSRNSILRVGGRMLPHLVTGAGMAAKGAAILSQEDPNGPFYPQMANRAAGLGMIGTGLGIAERGANYAIAPGVPPDARSIAIMESNQLRRSGIPASPIQTTRIFQDNNPPISETARYIRENISAPSPGNAERAIPIQSVYDDYVKATQRAGGTPVPPQAFAKIMRDEGFSPQQIGGAPRYLLADQTGNATSRALPAPTPGSGEASIANGERLRQAARAAGATGSMTKRQAADFLKASLESGANRAVVGKALGVNPGRNFANRLLSKIEALATTTKRLPAIIAPIAAAGLAYAATPNRAEAGQPGSQTGPDTGEALTNAAIAGGTAYGVGRALQAAPIAGEMTGPIAAMTYDPLEGATRAETAQNIANARADVAMHAPFLGRMMGVTPQEIQSYQMAQVPEPSPVRLENAAQTRQTAEYLRGAAAGEPVQMPSEVPGWGSRAANVGDPSVANAYHQSPRKTVIELSRGSGLDAADIAHLAGVPADEIQSVINSIPPQALAAR